MEIRVTDGVVFRHVEGGDLTVWGSYYLLRMEYSGTCLLIEENNKKMI
jgi:hypothetical protein